MVRAKVLVLIALVAVVGAVSGSAGLGDSGGPARSSDEPYYELIATVTGMMDGDTFHVDVTEVIVGHQGVSVGEDTVRLAGINAWELSDPGGPEAREFIEAVCPPGTTVYLDLDSISRGHGPRYDPYRGNYGRLIAVAYAREGEKWVNLNALVVLAGHGDAVSWFSSEFNSRDWLVDGYPYA